MPTIGGEPGVVADIVDLPAPAPILDSELRFAGVVFDVVSDTIVVNEQTVVREVIRHPGAVAVVALRQTLASNGEHESDQWQILMVTQYRHPLGRICWELPAGLKDVAGEPAVATASRELLEETGYEADNLALLGVSATSPGGSDELIEIFWTQEPRWKGRLATVEAEEISMQAWWVPLALALAAIDDGRITNLIAQVGIFAAARKITS